MLGRDFVPQDDQPGAPGVVILGSRIWTARYNADPTIIGRRVRVNGVPSTVIGVMPDGFRFPVVSDMWQPLATPARTHEPDARHASASGIRQAR